MISSTFPVGMLHAAAVRSNLLDRLRYGNPREFSISVTTFTLRLTDYVRGNLAELRFFAGFFPLKRGLPVCGARVLKFCILLWRVSELLRAFARVLAFVFRLAEQRLRLCDGVKEGSDAGSDGADELFFDAFRHGVIPLLAGFQPGVFKATESIIQSGTGTGHVKAFHVGVPA